MAIYPRCPRCGATGPVGADWTCCNCPQLPIPARTPPVSIDEVEAVLERLEPHLDAIVCYASTMGEHEPNRIAHDVRALLTRIKERQ